MLVAVEEIPVGHWPCKRACTGPELPLTVLLAAPLHVLSREERRDAREGVHDEVLPTLRDRLALFDMQFQPISTGPGRHALDGFEYLACARVASRRPHHDCRVSHGLLLAYGTLLPRSLHIGKAHERDGVRGQREPQYRWLCRSRSSAVNTRNNARSRLSATMHDCDKGLAWGGCLASNLMLQTEL